jgi:hypothetical protein
MYAIERTTLCFTSNIPVRIRRLDEISSAEHSIRTSNLSPGAMYFQPGLDTPIRGYLRMPAQVFGHPVVKCCRDRRVIHLGLSSPSRNTQDVGLLFYT